MSLFEESDTPLHQSPRILVVDDDRRVRELLEIALSAHGYEVATAADGEEAIRRALSERSDLVVLDVRLPRRSGLEVCEVLRADAPDAWIPIIMVSAASETDARLQGFARGADDYLAKPFSPKELVARIKRLLSRSTELRAARTRAAELERELERARGESRRAHLEAQRARDRHVLGVELARELNDAADPELLARRLLAAVQTRIGAPVAALLWAWRPGAPLSAAAVRGDGLVRIAGIEVPADGGLARALAGLGRPVAVAELERIEEGRAALPPFVTGRFGLLVPIRDRTGLIALIAAEERPGGGGWSRVDLEALAGITEAAAVPVASVLRQCAQMEDLIGALADRAPRLGAASFHAEAAAIARRAAGELALEPRLQGLIGHAVALAEWTRGAEGAATLERLGAFDRSGTVKRLGDLIAAACAPPGSSTEAGPDAARAAGLVAAAARHAEARTRGAGLEEACAKAIEACGARLDPTACEALRSAARDAARDAGHAA